MFSFLPKVIFREITDLMPEYFEQRGIRLLMLDFDNTLLPYTVNTPTQRLLDWIETFRESSVQLCIVSNSKKPRVRVFSKQYGVDAIQGAKKPFSKGIKACLKQYGIEKKHAALVGDQIYTDVLGANCAGVYSVLVKSIHNHTFWLKLRHVAEVPFIFMAKGRKYKYEKP